ncbi:class I SAM-dependent methyltransferase [Gracilimonas mengyeensis]|uniref:Methyltransferase domain-containing protein n=1 Tax=Gracilimonas mengyeensis TaxID=1302730 RepID=A0A521F9R8_9BACT|nr:class I SAM-dependent methyltransferase [Gracilimonas mengyeensis]SMO92876.1 Methyltransferase domain-containing protein [Gracilimonas mengyeensis]
MQDFWNDRFADKDFVYGKAPNDFFRQEIDKLSPGKLLLPADGEGRNAVYAAKNGWEVTAVDYSTSARQKALQLAKEFNTDINYELGNLAEHDFGVNRFDAAAFIYVHLPRSIISDVYQNVIRSLKTGGHIIVEVYSVNQLGRDSGGPKDKRVLYTEERLRNLLSGTKIHQLEETEIDLSEGKFHNGKAMVIRALATVL